MEINENISIKIDNENKILWLEFGNNHELHFSFNTITNYCNALDSISCTINKNNIHTVVIRSLNKKVWNMGGDLEFFVKCVKEQNIDLLSDYAYKCIKAIHAINNGFGTGAVVISLIQGNAFGGGFECALASDYLVSEEEVRYCFPESLFGTFPGMGAYSFLTRKVGFEKASQIINSTSKWDAKELRDMKIIDMLIEKDSIDKLTHLIKNKTFLARGIIAKKCSPTLLELSSIVDEWIRLVLSLNHEKLELMTKLVIAQKKLLNTP